MRDPFENERTSKWRLRLLAFDAWLDSTLHDAGNSLGEAYERVFLFMRKFRAEGFSRVAAEAASEAATLGVAGAFVLLAFAVPAFDAIHKDWRTQSEFAVTFLDRYGNEIGKRGVLQDDSLDLEDLPDHLIKAVLATEDRRFFSHFGIDVFGTFRAMIENARAGGVVQGGSSITQQLAKNLFLSNERSLERKVKEAYLALWLEANLSKKEILKFYLDRAYMGGGTIGVAAAAEFYFGKKATDLNLSESAMLAGLFKAPSKYAPHVNLPEARARANVVLTNMVQAGLMTEGQVVGARRHPAIAVERGRSASPDYFLDYAFEEVKRLAPAGERVLVARTTIDMRMQRAAEASLESTLRESGEAYNVTQGALVSIETDGSLRAMVGGRDYGTSTFNRATNALRQPGSSFKPYVYAVALEHGYTPDSIVNDAPVSIGNWTPQNYGRRYSGRVTLENALTRSLNTVAVRLSIETGRQPIADMAAAMGVETPIRVTRSLPLGTSELTVMDQARAYLTLANAGIRVPVRSILSVQSPSGEVVYDAAEHPGERKRVLGREAALGMIKMMHNVVENGTGRRARLPGVNAAGKTGTTNSYRDAWFCGYTGNFATAVWLGNDNYEKTRDLTGGTLPAETWGKYMRVAQAYEETRNLAGLEPPAPVDGTEAVAEDGLPEALQPHLAGRLRPDTLDALGRLETRFKAASVPPLKQASLPPEPQQR